METSLIPNMPVFDLEKSTSSQRKTTWTRENLQSEHRHLCFSEPAVQPSENQEWMCTKSSIWNCNLVLKTLCNKTNKYESWLCLQLLNYKTRCMHHWQKVWLRSPFCPDSWACTVFRQEVWAIVDFFHCKDYSMKSAVSPVVKNAGGKTWRGIRNM